jgi:hypothetical protein
LVLPNQHFEGIAVPSGGPLDRGQVVIVLADRLRLSRYPDLLFHL